MLTVGGQSQPEFRTLGCEEWSVTRLVLRRGDEHVRKHIVCHAVRAIDVVPLCQERVCGGRLVRTEQEGKMLSVNVYDSNERTRTQYRCGRHLADWLGRVRFER